MDRSERPQTLLEFGSFTLDHNQRLLSSGDQLVPLEPKVFDTLLALVEAEGRLLSKDELLEKVWPGTFVEEGSLARNVSTLRKVLGEGIGTARYIETIPKRGYRFLAAVRQVPFTATATARRPEYVPRWALISACLAIAVSAVSLTFVQWTPSNSSRTGDGPVRSLAVLPFHNLTGDSEQDYFSDGTTEQLIATLAQVHALRVISRTSVMRYKGTTKSLAEIARELGVDAILEGSVQQSDGTVRLTTQLVDPATDTHLWAKTFDANLSDLMRVQADVSRSVAEAIEARLTPADVERLARVAAINPAAQDEVFRGHAYRWRGLGSDGEDVRKAIAHYARASELQPDYAMAHAGLALAWDMLSGSAHIEQSRAAAVRAIQLDPELAEAHAAMAAVNYRAWDWDAGHAESRRALAISPGSLDGCLCYAIALAATGQVDEAATVAEQAIARNPLSAAAHFAHGFALYYARRYAEAATRLQRAIVIDARYQPSYVVLSYVLAASGRPQEAVALLEQPAFRDSPFLAIAYARAGRRADALRLAQELTTSSGMAEQIALARLYLALGDKERGLEALARAIDAREVRAERVLEENFDSVRADPRFGRLVVRLNFPPSYERFFAP